MSWAHVGTVIVAAFVASLVEFVEALTIVLAVGTTRGWRPALIGAGAGLLFLTGLTLALGPALQRIPLGPFQLLVGVLLVLFGMRWLRKAILRAGGVIAPHDETAIYATQTAARISMATSFKAVTLEGLEVVFIVIATGARGLLVPAALGAALAGALVVLAGVGLRRPLARVPENALKFGVGVLLSAFGVFWVGEGLGYPWPGQDLALLGLVAGFSATGLLAVAVVRRSAPSAWAGQSGGPR